MYPYRYILILLILIPTSPQAQVFMHVDSTIAPTGEVFSDIGYYDTENCQNTTLGTFFPADIQDLAIAPHGTIYCYGSNDIVSGLNSVVGVDNLGNGILRYHPSVPYDSTIAGMTCDEAGNLYLAGKGIWRVNTSLQATYLGDLPAAMQCRGDISWWKGQLILTSVGHQLVAVDLQDLANSQVLMDFPAGIDPIHGLAVFNIHCDSTLVYAVGKSQEGSTVYLLDIDNQSLSEVCDTDIPMMGAATDSECAIPACEVWVDLDADDNSGAGGLDFAGRPSCVPPLAVVDDDASVFSTLQRIDSVTLSLQDILDAGSELLRYTGTGSAVGISGNNSVRLVIYHNSTSTLTDFADALREVVYDNLAPVPSYGSRTIEVVAYEYRSEGQSAVATLTLGPPQFSWSADMTEPHCFGFNDGAIGLTISGGEAPYALSWAVGSQTNPATALASGSHTFTITDAKGCTHTDSIYLLQPDTLAAEILYAGTSAICGDIAQLEARALGGTAPFLYSWNTGANGPVLTNQPAGTYAVQVEDAHGCIATDSLSIEAGSPVWVTQQEELCEGEQFNFQGNAISTDTSFCLSYTLASGCDSTFCLDVHFTDTVMLIEYRELCAGDTLVVFGETISSDHTLCVVYSGVDGCDSTYCLVATFSKPESWFNDSLCLGAAYDFGGQLLTQAGIYQDTLLAVNGCDSIIHLELSEVQPQAIDFELMGSLCKEGLVTIHGGLFNSYWWSTGDTSAAIEVIVPGLYLLQARDADGCEVTDSVFIDEPVLEAIFDIVEPSCYDYTDGFIEVEAMMGGNPPYQYSLNGQPFQAEPVFTGLGAGSYELLVEDAEGCHLQERILLTQPPAGTVSAGTDHNIKLGEAVKLAATSNLPNPSIQWLPPDFLDCTTCLTTISEPLTTTVYQLIVSDENGCTATDSVTIHVSTISDVFIPNIFSPNGDGINDHFTIFAGVSITQIAILRIYNRWGALVFEAKNTSANKAHSGWDGYYKGKPMPSGVYTYYALLRRLDGATEVKKGEVTLVR